LQGNLVDALKVAMKKDKISKSKSPWDCMNIMDVYLRLGSKNDALDWLQEAVSRGFISYRLLQDRKYALVEREPRFYEIIETIKVSIGLGYPALSAIKPDIIMTSISPFGQTGPYKDFKIFRSGSLGYGWISLYLRRP
jgi:hypothetical protein